MSTQTTSETLDLDWRMPPLRETRVFGRRIAYYEKGEGPRIVPNGQADVPSGRPAF
jgi:hypothetical protein